MYEDFYGLREKPFNLTPDPRFLFLSESHRVALEHLIYGIAQKEGFMLIIGDVGTGKTTICRALLERLDEKTETALILNPQLSEEELLLTILSEFGITFSETGKKRIIDRLNQFLLEQLASGGKAVLIIDEAQNLSLTVLEQIRLLSNLETEKEKLLQIILIGQQELKTKLELPVLRQLNQRISVRFNLTPLNKVETKRYIEHRLMIAGSEGGIDFSNRATPLIYEYSQGIPRLINLISDRCLLGGYIKQTNHITPGIVKEAVKSLGSEKVSLSRPSLFSVKRLGYLIIAFLLILTLLIILQGRIPLKLPFLTSRLKPEVSPVSNDTKPAEISVYKKSPNQSLPAKKVNDTRIQSSTSEKTTSGETTKPDNFYSYTIHLESYLNKESALSETGKLDRLGYEIHIAQVNIPGKGVWYRLLLGKFKDEKTARKIMKKLKEKGLLKKFPDAVLTKTSYALGKSR